MFRTGLILFVSLLAGCSFVYPSDDFVAGAQCGGDVGRYVGAPPCAASVFLCANGCERGLPCCNDMGECNDACVQRCQTNCIAEEPLCLTCVIQNSTECVNANGCQAEFDEYDCCVVDSCGFRVLDTPAGDTCVENSCATEGVRYSTCSDGAAIQTACESTFLSCAQTP